MAEGAAVLEAKVDAFLREPRNEVQLPSGLVDTLKPYILGTLAAKEVPQDLPMTEDEWVSAVEGAYSDAGEAPPPMFNPWLKRWLSALGTFLIF